MPRSKPLWVRELGRVSVSRSIKARLRSQLAKAQRRRRAGGLRWGANRQVRAVKRRAVRNSIVG